MTGGGGEVKQASVSVRITNRFGLHARPAAEFVKLAGRFSASVFVEKDGLEVNGKSIMGVMMLAAEPGSTICIRAEGEDCESAVSALSGLVRRGFDEQETDVAEEGEAG